MHWPSPFTYFRISPLSSFQFIHEYCSTFYPVWNIHNGLQRVAQNCKQRIQGTGKRSKYLCMNYFVLHKNIVDDPVRPKMSFSVILHIL